MASSNKTILVLGATGRQGGATARHLLRKGWPVRAFVRDPQTAQARTLREIGAEIFQGTYEDRSSLEAAMKDVYGVFSVQANAGEEEQRQGQQIADVARAAGVQHFIYTSMQDAETLGKFGDDAKWQIEQYIQTLDLPATILRPSFFMDTLIDPYYVRPDNTFAMAVHGDVTIGMIATDDIGAFATLAFEHSEAYVGQTIELSGDVLTPLQVAAALTQAVERPIAYVQVPIETVRQQSERIARSIDYLNERGYNRDLTELRRQHPGLMSFATWLEKEGKAKLASQATPSI
jgi:uncharacterized protein YbjT (DUF2867 family)